MKQPGIGPQVLVHVSNYQGNPCWGYPIFDPIPVNIPISPLKYKEEATKMGGEFTNPNQNGIPWCTYQPKWVVNSSIPTKKGSHDPPTNQNGTKMGGEFTNPNQHGIAKRSNDHGHTLLAFLQFYRCHLPAEDGAPGPSLSSGSMDPRNREGSFESHWGHEGRGFWDHLNKKSRRDPNECMVNTRFFLLFLPCTKHGSLLP